MRRRTHRQPERLRGRGHAVIVFAVLFAGRAHNQWALAEADIEELAPVLPARGPGEEVPTSPLFLDASGLTPSTYSPPASLNQTSFVVLSWPRSASTSFVHLLNKHRMVQCDGEVFSEHGLTHFPSWTLETRDADRTAFMRDVFERTRTPPSKRHAAARGFKIFSYQLLESELLTLTQPRHVLKLVLRRQDAFAEYVSVLRMRAGLATSRPQTATDVARSSAFAVEIDWDDYEAWLATRNAWFDWCAQQARDHPESWLFITTEQLVSNPYAMTAVYVRLRVPSGKLMNYEPYVETPLEQKISNWDEIKDRVAAIPHEEPNRW